MLEVTLLVVLVSSIGLLTYTVLRDVVGNS